MATMRTERTKALTRCCPNSWLISLYVNWQLLVHLGLSWLFRVASLPFYESHTPGEIVGHAIFGGY